MQPPAQPYLQTWSVESPSAGSRAASLGLEGPGAQIKTVGVGGLEGSSRALGVPVLHPAPAILLSLRSNTPHTNRNGAGPVGPDPRLRPRHRDSREQGHSQWGPGHRVLGRVDMDKAGGVAQKMPSERSRGAGCRDTALYPQQGWGALGGPGCGYAGGTGTQGQE